MMEISQKYQRILAVFLRSRESLQSSDVHEAVMCDGERSSIVTTKRTLAQMVRHGLLAVHGKGRGTRYVLRTRGRLFADIAAHDYCVIEPDRRYGMTHFSLNLFSELPPNILTSREREAFDAVTAMYQTKTTDLPPTIQKKELERLIIELAWKSSKIEGNTYTLLDTEKLIREHRAAKGHSKDEAQMILNHKDAFLFIHAHASAYKMVTQRNLEELHAILIKGLGVTKGLRTKPVGVTGSIFRPLDNVYQITDAVEALHAAVARVETPYAKAMIALLGISYIQPFEDGNKRTGRLMANALLLAHGCAPLSYRSINEDEYREALFVFYELNSLVPFKKVFLDQYTFAAQHYAVS